MDIEVSRPITATREMLDDKVALITGSTSGIGLGVARSFASSGASVVLNGFGKPEEIKDTVERLQRETGTRAIYSAADMTKPDEIAEMVNLVLQTFGRDRDRRGMHTQPVRDLAQRFGARIAVLQNPQRQVVDEPEPESGLEFGVDDRRHQVV